MHTNADDASSCVKCGFKLQRNDQTVTSFSAASPSPSPSPVAAGASGKSLPAGSLVANRYEIRRLLGEGGMGAVYQATDRELDRTVALKVIRPELAGNAEVLARFKQELILARKITHRNVIRIFDLGVTDELKFITMEFVEGRDLHSILQEKKLPPEEAVRIIRQVCEALAVAHAEQVVHRDLKPHNIMVDGTGRVWVMDFGLARSLEGHGMTQTGAFMGTPAYMSPEQATSVKVDGRSDIFALGIIFYEMLTGEVPYQADTVLGSLLKRTQGLPAPPVKLDASVPKPLNDITLHCLAVDPANRYQDVSQMIADLDAYLGMTPSGRKGMTILHRGIVTPRIRMMGESRAWKPISISVAVTLAVMGGVYTLMQRSAPGPAPSPMTVLVADFANTTGEPIFNATLEPALTVALEGATFISSYNRGEARKVATQLQPDATRIDEPLAKLVAVRQGIGVVVAGSVSKEAGGYRLAVRAVDAFTGKVIDSEQLTGINKDGVLVGTAKLAARLRKALRDDTPESLQLAAAETFSASSVEAAHNYALAEQAEWSGKAPEAIAYYSKSVELDPGLGRAYANMAAIYANQGKFEEAEGNQRLAMARIDRMSDRERYKTRGIYYLVTRNDEKAIEELSALIKQYPSDGGGLQNLALAYFYHRDFAKALEIGRRASQLFPKNVAQLNNVALYAMYAGNFTGAIKDAQSVLAMNSSFGKAYLALALSSLAMDQSQAAADNYQKLSAVSSSGASLGAMGLADLALYEGRMDDAVALLEKGIASDLEKNSTTAAAMKSAALAMIHAARGAKPQVQAAAERALKASKNDSVQITAGLAYARSGMAAKADPIVKALSERLSADPRAYAHLINGEVELQRGNVREALRLFNEAQKLADTWLGRFDRGRAYIEIKEYTEANSDMDSCLKRRGEATAIFLDDVPSFHFLAEAYYYMGRAQEGLKSPGAADTFKTFLRLREKGPEDRLVLDARKRLASL
jgi:tetratricopeptide (TPR) repeat protein/predicted Ser/Thr protein kinase